MHRENGVVFQLLFRPLIIWLVLCSFTSLALRAQEAAPPQSPASPATPLRLNLPDTPGGLEHLAKEIIKAEKEGDTARAAALGPDHDPFQSCGLVSSNFRTGYCE
jgi:hypothetical protein